MALRTCVLYKIILGYCVSMCIHVNVRIDKPSFLRFGRSYNGHAKTVTQPWFVNVCQAKLLPLRKRFSSLEVEVMPKVWIPVVAPEGLAASLNGALMGQFRHWGVVSQKELGETLAGKLPASQTCKKYLGRWWFLWVTLCSDSWNKATNGCVAYF